MANTDTFIGKTFGNITITAQLGAGGMGMVYRGHHNTTMTEVAVKLIRQQNGEENKQYVDRFMQEIRVAAQIRDKNVVQVLDAGSEHGMTYLILELVDGVDIGEIIDEKGSIDPRLAVTLATGIASGINAIHKKGIIHRDIKPDNVLLGPNNVVKITDLGLARQLDESEDFNRLTVSGMVVGTPWYLAPEAIRDSRSAGAETDIYSFGATVYHMLAGKPPFDAPSAYEVMRKHLEDRHQPLREINPAISRSLSHLIDSCLQKEPEKRPSAQEVVNALGHNSKVNSGTGGMALVALFLLGCLGTAAIVSWKVLVNSTSTILDEHATAVHLTGNLDGAHFRFDNVGRWERWENIPVAITAGPHSITVEKRIDGKKFIANKEFTVEEHHKETLPILDLQPAMLTTTVDVRIPREDDMSDFVVYQEGQNIGLESSVYFDQVGYYTIALWNGDVCKQKHIQINENGSFPDTEWERCHHPPATAYFTSLVKGQQTMSHHLVSWWECNKVVTGYLLTAPTNWAEQASDPYKAAIGVQENIIKNLLEWRAAHSVRLPNREEAHELTSIYDRGFWYLETITDENGQKKESYHCTTDRKYRALFALLPR